MLPNRLLSHLLDHFSKGSGLSIEIENTDWPGSWQLDHVLCEDVGQLVGCGVLAIHDELAAQSGVPGRGYANVCMDDAEVSVTISFESRPRADWRVSSLGDIDRFVDAWYDDQGVMIGWCSGTNLRQFVDGFALGSGASISVKVTKIGNLHHLYECIFRACGDAVRECLGLGSKFGRIPGDTSGLAGCPEYIVERIERDWNES